MKSVSSAAAADIMTFAPVARKVRAHVVLCRWLTVLRQTLLPASLVLVLSALSVARGGAITPWLGLLLWLVGTLAYSWHRRPSEYSALALWDEVTGRREAFASAWWFEQRGEKGQQVRDHIEKQRAVLPQALPTLRRDLPLRPDRWLALPLVLTVIGSMIGVVAVPHKEAWTMDKEMSGRAAEVAKKLAQTDWEKKKMAGLQEDERKQLEDLKQQMHKTAEDLTATTGKDARSVLAELERRAREAEKLAEEMEGRGETWASEKLIEALRQQTDTADLGDAVAAKNIAAAATAAAALARGLQAPQLAPEVKERMTESLKEARRQSESQDRQRMVGQNVLAAADRMQAGEVPAAAAEFQKLADKLRNLSLREQAQDELRQLAQQLRDSASDITDGNKNGTSMQQMNAMGSQGQGAPSTPQVPQQSLTPPGMGQSGAGNQMQTQGRGGQGQSQQMMTMGQSPAQQGQSAGGPPVLLAPVPGGAKSDGKKPSVLMPKEGDPGEPAGELLALTGSGLPPGVGKAPLNNTPTNAQTVGNQSVVHAQQSGEGQSSVRTVEGTTHAEQSTRQERATALETIAAEEAALDEASLPPARREQVRRYFNELRRRFEGK